jgi:hypothetical protein
VRCGVRSASLPRPVETPAGSIVSTHSRKGPTVRKKKLKKINHQLIERLGEKKKVVQPYRIMEELVKAHHEHLVGAKIALAWRFGWKEDKDGRLRLGQCRKVSDLDRDLHGYDFVILLNQEAWNAADFSEADMRALIDHELCHAEVARDKHGGIKVDEQGRTIWRVRGHDIEEFIEIRARHGDWTATREAYAKVAIERKAAPLLNLSEAGA